MYNAKRKTGLNSLKILPKVVEKLAQPFHVTKNQITFQNVNIFVDRLWHYVRKLRLSFTRISLVDSVGRLTRKRKVGVRRQGGFSHFHLCHIQGELPTARNTTKHGLVAAEKQHI